MATNTSFTHFLRVRYSECDAQKVVFNAKYAEYIDIAGTEYIRAVWGHYNTILAMGLDCQVVNLSVSWKSSAKFDDVLVIEVNTGSIGNSSFAFSFVIKNYATGEVIATAEVVYVMVDNQTYLKKAIPTELRQKLNIGAPGVCVNHSGILLKD